MNIITHMVSMKNGKNTIALVSVLPPCDICCQEGKMNVKAKYDSRTVLGFWANLCPDHFLKYGRGLGLGMGQELVIGGKL